MNPDYVAMARLRFQPRVIRTLERRIERDREELYRIRNDIMHGREPARRLKRMERTMVARIGKNTEKLGKMRSEDAKLRQKLSDLISDEKPLMHGSTVGKNLK